MKFERYCLKFIVKLPINFEKFFLAYTETLGCLPKVSVTERSVNPHHYSIYVYLLNQ